MLFLEVLLAKIITKRSNAGQMASVPINENISASEVRLVGADGSPMGIVPIAEALRVAFDSGMDLVLVAEESSPPVCKILDYGKYKYELQKKKTESKKKQRVILLKEVQLRPSIGANDLLVKCRAIKKFIEAGDKVKIALRFRGREMSRKEKVTKSSYASYF